MDDPYDLQPVIEQAKAELRAGRKRSHWMWFVFPQLKGLGHSEMATWYGIGSRQEAEAYLKHPTLGPRLRECCQLVNNLQKHQLSEVLGYPDDLKFRSSMTLFALVSPNDRIFQAALDKYFEGKLDDRTTKLLG